MSDLIDDKLKENCKLLVEKRFTIVSDVSDDLICGICKDILVNASQTICGCLFCEKCIDKYVEYNTVGCPGNTEDCKLTSLSNIMIDHRRNLMISRLIVRCNKENCRFECKLMEMQNHLEDCSTETIECPFMIVGCAKERLSDDRMNEHLQRDSLNHNKLLLDMVNNFRNEIRELRENDEERKYEIENLKEKITLNETEIQILKENGETNKPVIERCVKEFDLLHENMEKNKDELKILREFREKIKSEVATAFTSLENRETHNAEWTMDLEGVQNTLILNSATISFNMKETEKLKETFEKHINETKNLQNYASNIGRNVNSLIADSKDELRDIGRNVNSLIADSKYELRDIGRNVNSLIANSKVFGLDELRDLRTEIDRLNDYLEMDNVDFLWHIGMVDSSVNLKYSDSFYIKDCPLKFGLKLDKGNDDLTIYLLLYNRDGNDDFDWPFRANVTIRIAHKFCRSKYLDVSNRCSIKQPRNKRYHQTFPFIFLKKNILSFGIPMNESVCVVECDIDIP